MVSEAFQVKDLSAIFSDVESTALAAASICQVHRATLLDGRKVIIKVKHSNIDETMAADLAMIPIADKTIGLAFPDVKLGFLAAIWKESVRQELDFRNEGYNRERMSVILSRAGHMRPANKKNAKGGVVASRGQAGGGAGSHEIAAGGDDGGENSDGHVALPRVVWRYTTKSVMVQEFVEHAVPIDDFDGVRGIEGSPTALLWKLAHIFAEGTFIHGQCTRVVFATTAFSSHNLSFPPAHRLHHHFQI